MAAYLPMASLGMQAAGAAMGTVGSYYSAQNTKSNLQMQANLADTNAQIAELGAQSALAQGAKEEQRSRLQTTALKKSQRVAMAANGVDLGQGSAAEILTSTDLMGDIDANTIKANAVRNAWGYRTQATNYQNQALMNRASASSISPMGGAVSSLLGSAGAVGQSWYLFNQVGAQGFGKKAVMQDSGKATGSWW